MMETPLPPSPHVLVHVTPQLLGDVLTRVLRERRFEVATFPPGERRKTPRLGRRYDIAVVTDDLAVEVEAQQVIVLDADGSPRITRTDTEPLGASEAEGHLARLLALIDDLLI